MEIRTKRVYESRTEDDGLRILVDRMWPRGVTKEGLAVDSWERELTAPKPLYSSLKAVTILYASVSTDRTHAALLSEYLRARVSEAWGERAS